MIQENSLNLGKLSSDIDFLSRTLNEVKILVKNKEEKLKIISKRDKKRRESLKKAQKKFVNVSTNIKAEEYEKLEKKLKELKMSKSAYLKMLIENDLT
ncbi:MAG: hypothetical protein EOM50_19300 [Erysipelotrichia bacterium]|nr:hypothetical protein [Erysipelotrichia bacterium]